MSFPWDATSFGVHLPSVALDPPQFSGWISAPLRFSLGFKAQPALP